MHGYNNKIVIINKSLNSISLLNVILVDLQFWQRKERETQ